MKPLTYACLIAAAMGLAFAPTSAYAKLVTECGQGNSGTPCKDPPNPGSLTETLPPGQVDNGSTNPDNNSKRNCNGPQGLIPDNCK
jgi:hypothetical protein